jgi:hypothetical protein
MVHGELSWGKSLLTIVTDTWSAFSLPPLSGPKLPGLFPFFFDTHIVIREKR